jgi:hydrogenase maturation protease
MKEVLVIGYGNSIRSDDGAGIAAALRIAELWPGIATLVCHQLGPELAETIAAYETIVFIDASVAVDEPLLETLTPGDVTSAEHTHEYSPEGLLGFSNRLYDPVWKQAFLLHIPVRSIEFGERISEETDDAIAHGIEMLKSALANRHEVSQNLC